MSSQAVVLTLAMAELGLYRVQVSGELPASTVQYSTVQYSTARPLQGPGLFISVSRCSLFLHLVLSHFHVPQSRNARYGQIGQCGDGIWFLV